MAKDKKMKLEQDELDMINYFKEYLDCSIAGGNYARFVSYEEHHTKDDYALFAILDYDKFKAKIIHRPLYFLTDSCVDVKFILDMKYEYSIYDIFNLFNIKDFNQYYYTNINSKYDMENALSNILEMINKYSYDIEKATLDENIEKLASNFEADWTAVSGGRDDWKEEIHDPFLLDFVHPFYTSASDAVNSDKLLKKLQKQKSKGKLNTIYENRLLEYMEQGNEFVNQNEVERKNFEKGFGKSKGIVKALTFVSSGIIAAILIFAIKHIVFAGAYIPQLFVSVGSLEIPLSLDAILGWVFSTLMLGISAEGIFGKKFFAKIVGDNERSNQKYIAEHNMDFGVKKKISKIIINVICIVLAVSGVLFTSLVNIGFYDDSVKFADDNSLKLCSVSYDDIVVYKPLGYFNDNDEYIKYDNAYVVSDGKNHIYEIGEIMRDGETQKYIDGIVTNYNKEIIEIDSIGDIAE